MNQYCCQHYGTESTSKKDTYGTVKGHILKHILRGSIWVVNDIWIILAFLSWRRYVLQMNSKIVYDTLVHESILLPTLWYKSTYEKDTYETLNYSCTSKFKMICTPNEFKNVYDTLVHESILSSTLWYKNYLWERHLLNCKKTCLEAHIEGLHLSCEWYLNYSCTSKLKMIRTLNEFKNVYDTLVH